MGRHEKDDSDGDPGLRRIAVVGSGAAGLVAAHELARADHVTLYEADDRLGGHAHTHRFEFDGRAVHVDSGFIVHNDRTYPTLLRLFDELGVATQESDMSMSIRDEETGLEYAGARGWRGLFPTSANLRRPRFWKMLVDVTRFHRAARAALASGDGDETLGDFLDRHGFDGYFRSCFVTPLVAAVWSCDAQLAIRYPARYLFAFLSHHGMLTVFGSPTWRTVTGGSARYVEAIEARLQTVLTGTPVTEIHRLPDGVRIVDGAGGDRIFDGVVVAAHPRQALAMLAAPTDAEREILGAMPYSRNHAQVHTDESLLPRAERARASWNHVTPRGGDAGSVVVTYDLTRLMRLDHPRDRRILVTLGGGDYVDPATVLAETTYEHPQYTPDSVAAQARLPELASDRLVFAGAYHGWGFHEDAALSGLRAAERLCANRAPASHREPEPEPAQEPA